MSLIKQPSLFDVTKFYRHRGLVGEEKTALLQTLLSIKKQFFGIESPSGGGKSQTMDWLANHSKYGDKILLPDGTVYIMQMGSKTAQAYKHKELNAAKLIYIEELQKAGNQLEVTEMIKNLAEGKDFTRDVTDVIGGGVNRQKILKGKGIMYTLALENKHKTDEETKRRFVVLTTDVSKDQTERVLKRKAEERFAKHRLALMSNDDILKLKAHIRTCLDKENVTFQNPYSEAMTEWMPVPDQKVRSFVDHYFNIVEAVTLFHYRERFAKDENIFVNLEDMYITECLYRQHFIRDVYSMPPMGDKIIIALKRINYDETIAYRNQLQGLSRWGDEGEVKKQKWATVSDIHTFLKKQMNITLKHDVCRDSMNALYDAGFLERNTTNRGMPDYRLVEDSVSFLSPVDWQKVLDVGINNMKKFYPEQFDDWLAMQKTTVLDPITGEIVDLLELKDHFIAEEAATSSVEDEEPSITTEQIK